MEVVDLVLLERNAIVTLAGTRTFGRQGIRAERVATEVGYGALCDDVIVVGARDNRASQVKVVLGLDAFEESEL